MARGHQKELSRQRNEKTGNSNKPTTQKGTAGKIRISTFFCFNAPSFLAASLTYQCTICKVTFETCSVSIDSIFHCLDSNGRSQNIQIAFRK